MKKSGLLVSISLLLLVALGLVTSPVAAQSAAPNSSVTLYSPNKPRSERLRSCAVFEQRARPTAGGACDLRYGSLYAGDELDWFDSLSTKGRTVVRDLGQLNWTDKFTVPVVAPLPELKPGEVRSITVDTSGADGGDGADGDWGLRNMDIREDPNWTYRSGVRNKPSRVSSARPKHDGKPKIDPAFTKAIAGHLYVIHVVDEVSDFYALFRVDALERGDKCTISWKVIPAPAAQTAGTRPL